MNTVDCPGIGWPAPDLRLLLKTYYCTPEQARDAWHQWLATHSIDTATWAEVRLLSAIAQRVQIIDPDSPEQSRLDGIRRFVWTLNQIRLDRSMPVIDVLINANIPVMILKGVARIAMNQAISSARFVRDVDIMVDPSRLDEACDVLIANGWRPVNGILPGISRAEPFAQILPVSNGKNSVYTEDYHVDIHRSAIHYGRSGTFDDIFWTRCRDANLRGRQVKIPSSTDQFLHALTHGTIADDNRPADWVIDALDAVTNQNFNWDLFAEEVERRRAGAAIASGLDYLATDFGLDIPEKINYLITRDRRNLVFRTEVIVYWRLIQNRVPYGGVIRRLAEWSRSRHCLFRCKTDRKTLWHGRGVLALPGKKNVEELSPVTVSVIEYGLGPINEEENLDCKVEIVIAKSTQPEIYFDLLLDGIWFGRLLVDLDVQFDKRKYVCFKNIPLPAELIRQTGNTKLHIVHVNSKGRIPSRLPFHLEIRLSINEREKQYQCHTSFNEAITILPPVN